jgi:uncharacterized damage-inducible protein DinB
MTVRELLVDTLAFIPPRRALEQLSSEEATRRLPGATHTIAEIVGHLLFWQTWFLQRCRGQAEPMPASAASGWPEVGAASWDEVRSAFLEGLEQAAALGDESARLEEPIAPPIEFPPLAGLTRRGALTHVATHNAHHLGQVILLRQMLGAWPPPSGSWTW